MTKSKTWDNLFQSEHPETFLKLLESNGKFEIPPVFETEVHIEEDLDFGYCEALEKGKNMELR